MIQLCCMNINHLLNQPYVNEVNLTEQTAKPILKILLVSWSELMSTGEIKIFQKRYCESVDQRAAKLWSVKFRG